MGSQDPGSQHHMGGIFQGKYMSCPEVRLTAQSPGVSRRCEVRKTGFVTDFPEYTLDARGNSRREE